MREAKDLLKKLEPVIGSKVKSLWYLNLFTGDVNEQRENKELLRILADKKARVDFQENIRLPPPTKEKLKGDYCIGDVIYPVEIFSDFGLREDEFIKHVLITGMTGMGKTNLAFHLIRELAKKRKPFLIFDWKRNYRDLKQLPELKNLKVIRLGHIESDFKFNPLIPPANVNTKNWMALLVDVMKHAFFIGHGVEYFFRKGIDYLYEQYGVYDGKESYPTFIGLKKLLRKEFVKGREILWMSTVKRVLASLTFSGLLGEVLNVRQQNNIEDLLNHQVVIEMDALANIEKIFFIESLLLWLYEHRKQEGKREKFKHAIIIEEAHHVLSRRKEYTEGQETITESIVRMIREFGESIIVIDQEPSKVSNSILANTNCKICFTLGNGNDISTIAKAMNMTEQEKRYIDKLKVGHGIVKMKHRFNEPIHVRFPWVKIRKGFTIA